jgi:hypothetical protein
MVVVKQLSSFGPVKDVQLIEKMLNYFHVVTIAKTDFNDTIVEAMAAFLLHNPGKLRSYIRRTHVETFAVKREEEQIPEEDKKKKKSKKEIEAEEKRRRESEENERKFQQAVPQICANYLDAIAHVIQTHLDVWVSNKYINLGTM